SRRRSRLRFLRRTRGIPAAYRGIGARMAGTRTDQLWPTRAREAVDAVPPQFVYRGGGACRRSTDCKEPQNHTTRLRFAAKNVRSSVGQTGGETTQVRRAVDVGVAYGWRPQP